jgi:hypothetical protein
MLMFRSIKIIRLDHLFCTSRIRGCNHHALERV